MENKKNPSFRSKFVASRSAALLLISAAVGTTYALFSSQKKVNAHLTIGQGVKAGLYLTSLTRDEIDQSTGRPAEKTIGLSKYTSDGKSVYDKDIGGVDLSLYKESVFPQLEIAPTMGGKAEFTLVNQGDVAFTYQLARTKKAYDADGKELGQDASILTQIHFSLEDQDNSIVDKNAKKKFSLSFEFVDDEENNLVQGQSLDADISVHVVQVTK